MSTNNLVLLNQLLDQKLADVGSDFSEAEYFEIFSSEQITKNDNLSYDEILDGIVDGALDGGIDSIYFFVNNSLYTEDIDTTTCKRGVPLRLILIQSKINKGFSETGIEKFRSSTEDLFDLSKDINTLNLIYNENVVKKIKYFRET